MPAPSDLFHRHRHNFRLLWRFALVGASGVFVNLLVVIICNRVGPSAHTVAIDLPFTRFNVRWYHVFATIAFFVANLWNFQLNRWWTFGSSQYARWLREYLAFVITGLVALVANLGILTLLLHPDSPVALPTGLLDDTTGFRTRLYWAQLIAIVLVTPMSFLANKLWTFTAVRGLHRPAARPPAEDDARISSGH